MKQLACISLHVNPCNVKLPMPTTKLHRKIQINITITYNWNIKPRIVKALIPSDSVEAKIIEKNYDFY